MPEKEGEVKILNEIGLGVYGAEHLTQHDVDIPKEKKEDDK